jgi:hypothetical protein
MLQECIQLISVLQHRNLVILMMMPVNWMICSHRTGVVADISAYVDAAFSMLPLILPKPIWEQGVWADIFGDFFPPVASWLSPGRSTRSIGMQHVPLIKA